MLIEGSIPPRVQNVAIAAAILLLVFIINLIRREKLKEGYSIIWFLVGILLLTFASLAGLLDIFSGFLGIFYAPAALFLILISGLVLLSIHFSVLLSKTERQVKELAQEHALLKQQLTDARGVKEHDA